MTLVICFLHSDRDVFFVHGVKPAVKKSLHVTNSSSNFFSFELERKVLLLAMDPESVFKYHDIYLPHRSTLTITHIPMLI